MENQKTKVIFSKKLANILVEKGFDLLRTEINLKDVRYKVFIFVDTPELEAFVDSYTTK